MSRVNLYNILCGLCVVIVLTIIISNISGSDLNNFILQNLVPSEKWQSVGISMENKGDSQKDDKSNEELKKMKFILQNHVKSEEFQSSRFSMENEDDLHKEDKSNKKIINPKENFLDDCQHVYLDGGTNIGIQVTCLLTYVLYYSVFLQISPKHSG